MGYKKYQYVTDNYVEQVNHYLYNDIPLIKLIEKEDKINEEKYGLKLDKEWLSKFLLEGEKYVLLHSHQNVVVTNLGRIINTTKKRMYTVVFTRTTVGAYIMQQKVSIKQIFEKNDWKFDYGDILDTYNKHDWTHHLMFGGKSKKMK